MRVSISISITLSALLASFALATPLVVSRAPLSPDPAGVPHVGNGKGEQFITGQCLSNADCQSACCATLGSIGICSGPGAATQQGKTGCGFGSGAAKAAAPKKAAAGGGVKSQVVQPGQANGGQGLQPDVAGIPHVGNGKGEQFITGQCLSNADCASACCATLGSIGICSGPGAATQAGKTGCGFNSVGGGGGGGGAAKKAAPAKAQTKAASVKSQVVQPGQANGGQGLQPDVAGIPHVGNGRGEQFITGQCLSNADCASACCATLGSIGICSGPGAATQSGKTGCGFKAKA